jgi:hypothetical protein
MPKLEWASKKERVAASLAGEVMMRKGRETEERGRVE